MVMLLLMIMIMMIPQTSRDAGQWYQGALCLQVIVWRLTTWCRVDSVASVSWAAATSASTTGTSVFPPTTEDSRDSLPYPPSVPTGKYRMDERLTSAWSGAFQLRRF